MAQLPTRISDSFFTRHTSDARRWKDNVLRSRAIDPARLSARAATTVQSAAKASAPPTNPPDVEGPVLIDEDEVQEVMGTAQDALQNNSGVVEESLEIDGLQDIDVEATSNAVGQALNAIRGNFNPEVLDPAHQRERCQSFEGVGADDPVDLVLLEEPEAVSFAML